LSIFAQCLNCAVIQPGKQWLPQKYVPGLNEIFTRSFNNFSPGYYTSNG
jgi:hypothetical protein